MYNLKLVWFNIQFRLVAGGGPLEAISTPLTLVAFEGYGVPIVCGPLSNGALVAGIPVDEAGIGFAAPDAVPSVPRYSWVTPWIFSI